LSAWATAVVAGSGAGRENSERVNAASEQISNAMAEYVVQAGEIESKELVANIDHARLKAGNTFPGWELWDRAY
jgi:hypothetical protein